MRNRSLLGWLGGALLLGSVLASAIDTDPVWGADGIWSASANGDWSDAGNWSGGFAADGSGSTAFFNTVDVPTAGIVVSLDAPRTIGHLAFDDTNTGTAGSWTLAGPETLTLAGTSPSITVGSLGTGASATIATAITGSDGVTKAGTGTLTLAGANSYTGGTTVSTGALKGTIDSIRGDVSINAGATVQFQNPASNTIANKITGDGVFRVFFTGGGHVWINGLADFTGTVQLSKPVANGGKWTATGIGTLDAALIIDDLCQIYVAGPTTFNKGITVSGIGNTEYRGAIRLSNTLGGDITLAGDTTIGCENGTITGNITSGVAGTQTLTFAGAVTNRTATVLGSITDGVGTLALTQNLTDGTLRLAGNNSYSGLTTITKGTVQVGTGGTTGTLGTGNVVNDGALVFNRSNDLTVANQISGSGSLSKLGAGTLTLTGNNGYTGGTTVSAGALVGTVDSIRGPVQVANGATVQFNSSEITDITSTIAGDGVLRLNLSGTGSAIHTYMNNISAFTGVIELSNVGGGVSNKWTLSSVGAVDAALVIESGSQIFVNGTASFNQGISISGTGNTENRGAIRLASTLGGDIALMGDTTVGGEGGTLAGNITSGIAGTQTLTFAGSGNGNATLTGTITDGAGIVALTQNRAGGTLRLAGDSSYSGDTTVNAGTLLVTGALGQTTVTVNSGGTLAGSGSIAGPVAIHAAAILSPGASTAVLSVGELALESGSTTQIEINTADRGDGYDGIDIAASGSLSYGGTLSLIFGNTAPFHDGAQFDLFAFSGDASGALSEVTSSGYYAGEWEWDGIDTFSLASGRQTLLFQQTTGDLTIAPEPSGAALAILAMLILASFRRRNRPIRNDVP